jgi:hypothetical protein
VRRGYNDPLVLSTAQIGPILNHVVAEDGLEVVADRLGTSTRRLWDIIEGRQKWVQLSVVDRWLTRMGLAHLLNDGTLSLVANPSWSQGQWVGYWNKCGDEVPEDVEPPLL